MNAKSKSVWEVIKSDSFRQQGRFSWWDIFFGALFQRTFRVVITLRLCQAASQKHILGKLLLPLLKILHRIASHLAGLDMSWRTSVGLGFTITHGWGLVISQGAVIGSNVTLFHGVTLGRRDVISALGERTVGYPTLEDDVWVGPHAVIVGNVTIGRGSRIAAGAFVVDNIPPHSLVVGNPAKIVKWNCQPDVFNRYQKNCNET